MKRITTIKVFPVIFILFFTFTFLVLGGVKANSAIYNGGQLPERLSYSSEITGTITQAALSLNEDVTLSIKDQGKLVLISDASINNILKDGGRLIIEKGGELEIKYMDEKFEKTVGIIENYGKIVNAGSIKLAGLKIYNYGEIDNQNYIELKKNAKIYDIFDKIDGKERIKNLDGNTGIFPPLSTISNSGIVLKLNLDGSNLISNQPEKYKNKNGINITESGIAYQKNKDKVEGQENNIDLETTTETALDSTVENQNTSSAIDDNTENQEISPAIDNNKAKTTKKKENPLLTKIVLINNIPDNIEINSITQNENAVVDITEKVSGMPEKNMSNLNEKINGNFINQKHIGEFYLSPTEGLDKGIHKGEIKVNFSIPTFKGAKNMSLSIPVKIIIGKEEVKKTKKVAKFFSIINLIIMIATITLMAIFILRTINKSLVDSRNIILKNNSKTLKILLTIPLPIISIISFFTTENVLKKMIYFDKWTILMSIIFILECTIIFSLRNKRKI
ncbi:MAG: hypothetical protein LBD41_03360 [Clostridiales Family XIII bacterium]|jgi:hypothetical protein|nr:hypothetical protein [Clostridiales Family XIII bacterium]